MDTTEKVIEGYFSDRGFIRENSNESYRWVVADRSFIAPNCTTGTFTLCTKNNGIIFCKNEIELLVKKMQDFLDKYEELDEKE